MDYHWFPGHMAKAIRQMKEDIKLVDLVIELVDARIPYSSSNPVLDQLARDKSRIIALNKADLSEEKYNEFWKRYFESKGQLVLECNSKNKKGLNSIYSLALEACKEKIEKNRKKGLINKPIRAMIVGIPNVGKSTFINAIAGRNVAKTGNKPGVTKGKQWIRLRKDFELLDTPGVLWPKFEDENIGRKIAFIGSINDDILYSEDMAYDMLLWMRDNKKDLLQERYGIEVEDPMMAIESIGKTRGCLKKGGEIDILRASNMLIDEFRAGKLGRVTLDREDSINGK